MQMLSRTTDRHDDTPLWNEASVVAAAKAGNSDAFGILVANHRRMVVNRVRQITGNLEDAEDVTQQALMKAYMNIGSFRGTCAFSSWLTRIAINEALMLKRRPWTRSEVGWAGSVDESGVVPEIADARPNPEQCYDNREQHQLVEAAMKALSPASRLALQICVVNEDSLKDLALIQGSSVAAAKSRLFRSRSLLRAKVNRALAASSRGRAQLSRQAA